MEEDFLLFLDLCDRELLGLSWLLRQTNDECERNGGREKINGRSGEEGGAGGGEREKENERNKETEREENQVRYVAYVENVKC